MRVEHVGRGSPLNVYLHYRRGCRAKISFHDRKLISPSKTTGHGGRNRHGPYRGGPALTDIPQVEVLTTTPEVFGDRPSSLNPCHIADVLHGGRGGDNSTATIDEQKRRHGYDYATACLQCDKPGTFVNSDYIAQAFASGSQNYAAFPRQ